VAQSGAVCTAMLDFAAPMGIGFSTVISLGAGVDINFGEMLDCLLVDPATDGILLYVESVRDARRFLSALRAAARTGDARPLQAPVVWLQHHVTTLVALTPGEREAHSERLRALATDPDAHPRRAAAAAYDEDTGPAPTTAMLFLSAAGLRTISVSRQARGLTRQEAIRRSKM